MAEQRESSFLFSLKNMLELEKQRSQAEQLAQMESHRQRTRERELFAREMLEKKRVAEMELLRLAQQQRQETAARIETLRLATLEKARIESEARARLEVLEKQQDHERKLYAIREASRQKGAMQLAIVGLSLAVLCTLGFTVLYFGKLRPESQRLEGAYDDLVTAQRTRAEETAKLLARADKRADDLDRDLRRARRNLRELAARKKPSE
jgi:colicin import membrane protein